MYIKIKLFIKLAIIIDVVMVGKKIMNKVMHNSLSEQIYFNSDLLCNDNSDRLHGWLSLDSKYTEQKIIENISENKYKLIHFLLLYIIE